MSKRDVPKINRDNFLAWKILMNLHPGGLGNNAQSTIITKHIDPTGALTIDDLKKKKEHNKAMLEIASIVSYIEFDDIKSLYSAKKMWDDIHTIYGGDKNVLRAKVESLR